MIIGGLVLTLPKRPTEIDKVRKIETNKTQSLNRRRLKKITPNKPIVDYIKMRELQPENWKDYHTAGRSLHISMGNGIW